MLKLKLDNEVLVEVLMDKVDNKTQQQDIDNIFPLRSGWALKESQKFGKKGAGKRMSKKVRALLEGFFMAGNANKSDRYNAQDMHKELLKCVEEGEISNEEVPKSTTIQNWITKTTAEHRERAALKVLNENTF
ncbi:1635_t:CDS:2 [Gigaspora margarita]|uniref:1635_t:CDS:1 n=1 Tax=Gigaspora margarita TaxID=4874 RepID=A0ABN7VER7_GIGMA|nr:1635_t:CDS:2 [Gigaspora margarita]